MKLLSLSGRLLPALALLALPGLAEAQASIPNYEFVSAAVDYPANTADPNSIGLQGSFGQTFVTVDPPTNQNQTLAYAGFGETAVKFRYKGQVALDGWENSVLAGIPLSVHFFNNLNGAQRDDVRTAIADNNGFFFVDSWINPAFVGNMSVKAPIWLRQGSTLVAPADPVNDYPFAGYVLSPGDVENVDTENEIGLDDLVVFFDAYGSVNGDGNWNVNADLNGDDEVGLTDLVLFFDNYGKVGDP